MRQERKNSGTTLQLQLAAAGQKGGTFCDFGITKMRLRLFLSVAAASNISDTLRALSSPFPSGCLLRYWNGERLVVDRLCKKR